MRTLIPPPILGLLTGAAMWALAHWTPGIEVALPGLRFAAAAFLLTGAMIEIIAIATFVRKKTTVNPMKPSNAAVLVTGGLYRISRNPMYLALLFVLIGWGLWLGNILNAGLLAIFVWYMNEFQIKPEESALQTLFGEDYTAYCRRVRRWI